MSLFICYGLFGAYLPDPIANRGYSLKRVASQIYLGGGGIFGTPLGVSATFVTGVVVLGTLLEKAGAGQVLMDFATALTGRMQSGPEKAAVVGSSLMGMISGTAVANVLTTGPISIPLMRKSGYRKEAAKRKIPILRNADSVTDWVSILRNSYLLLPLPVFISMLLNGYSIMLSSFWAIVASTLVSYLPKPCLCADGDRSEILDPRGGVVERIGSAGACSDHADLPDTGYGSAHGRSGYSGGNAYGPGPCGPWDQSSRGASFRSVFGHAVVNHPPVALAAYAAASIANGNPLKIAVLACQFGMGAFAVPYFFVYDPTILGIDVTWLQITVSFVTAILGGICASASMLGFLTGRLNLLERLLFAGAALLFMKSNWQIDVAALTLLGALVFWTSRHVP